MEIVWFFGSSCAGKQTLIEAIIANPKAFAHTFDFSGAQVHALKEASIWISRKNHDQRPNLISAIKDLTDQHSDKTILVKGQSVDLAKGLLQQLQADVPNVKQSIVFVYTDPAETLERWKTHRDWYKPSMTVQSVVDEVNYQVKFIRALANIPTKFVDGGKGKKYAEINSLL